MASWRAAATTLDKMKAELSEFQLPIPKEQFIHPRILVPGQR
jgi:hypothetical protein